MDGVHDLGGKAGYGAVTPDAQPIGFAERWHAAVFAIMRASYGAGATRNSDHFRHAVERVDPERYLADGYYGRWLAGLETLLIEGGVLSSDEIDEYLDAFDEEAPSAARPGTTSTGSNWAVADPRTAARETSPAVFAVGERVRSRGEPTQGHTRLPEYARDRVGRVAAVHGGWVLPDSNAHGVGESPQPLYTVAFDAAELWGSGREPGVMIHLDLFESYLRREPADD